MHLKKKDFGLLKLNTEIEKSSGKLIGRVTCRYRDQVSEYDPAKI